MSKSGNKKRKKLSSSSSTEAASSTEGKGEEAFESEKSEAMATKENVNENPSLVDVWKVLTEIKANTVKLVLDVESVKVNYNELKDSLYSTKSQVDNLVTENVAVNSKLKLLEEQVLTSKKELEEVIQRLYDVEGSQMYETAGDPKMTNTNIMRNAKRASEWYARNLLKGNLSKYQTMTLKHNGTESNIPLHFQGNTIESSECLSC